MTQNKPLPAKILLTGGSGFIGRALQKAFERQPVKFMAPGHAEADMATPQGRESLARLAAGADAIIHLAHVLDPEDAQFETLRLLVEHRRPMTRIIFASSMAVYGLHDHEPLAESAPCKPINLHGQIKLACEQLLAAHVHTVSLRIGQVTGPQVAKYTPAIIRDQLLASQPVSLNYSGNVWLDFVDVRDVVQAIQLAIKADKPAKVYNIGTGHAERLQDFAEEIKNRLNSSSEIILSSSPIGVDWAVMDITRARQGLGYKPAYNMEHMLDDLVYQGHLKQGLWPSE